MPGEQLRSAAERLAMFRHDKIIIADKGEKGNSFCSGKRALIKEIGRMLLLACHNLPDRL